jgi:hypothetical protein
VSVIWVAGHGASADDEAFRDGGRNADLGAELVAHPRLAFRDAIDLGFMQAVDFVLVLRLLIQQPPCQNQRIADLFAQRTANVSSRDLLRSKCGRNVSNRGARRRSNIAKILVVENLQNRIQIAPHCNSVVYPWQTQ